MRKVWPRLCCRPCPSVHLYTCPSVWLISGPFGPINVKLHTHSHSQEPLPQVFNIIPTEFVQRSHRLLHIISVVMHVIQMDLSDFSYSILIGKHWLSKFAGVARSERHSSNHECSIQLLWHSWPHISYLASWRPVLWGANVSSLRVIWV